MKESKVENALKKRIKKQGGIPYKFTSPGKRGVPDELILMPIPEEYRAIVNKYVYFVECKAPGKKPRAEQLKVHKEIRKLGYRVEVVDSI